MADFSLSKPALMSTKKGASRLGNVAYAIFVLLCFWSGSQALNLLVNSPGIFEHLMQGNDATRPHIDIGLAVNVLFGLGVFSAGALLLGIVVIAARMRQRL